MQGRTNNSPHTQINSCIGRSINRYKQLEETMIPHELCTKEFVWGQGGKYLEFSSNGLRISNKNPGAQTIRVMDIFLQKYGPQIQQELSQKSIKEVKRFAVNMIYFFEKLNTPLSRRVHPMTLPIYLTRLATSALITELTSTKIFSILPKRVGCKILKFRSNNLFRNLLLEGVENCQSAVLHSVRLKSLQKRFKTIIKPFTTRSNKLTIESIQSLGKTYAKVDQLWKQSPITYRLNPDESQKAFLVYRQFLKKQVAAVRDGYYVVAHGQTDAAAFIVDFLTLFAQKMEPQRDLKSFKCLRLNKQGDWKTAAQINARSYIQHNPHINDSAPPYNEKLLSVSIDPFDQTENESALWFWSRNVNKTPSKKFVEIAVGAIKNCYVISPAAEEKIRVGLTDIQNSFLKAIGVEDTNIVVNPMLQNIGQDETPQKVGSLYAICLPKEVVHDSSLCPIYQSGAFGPPLNPGEPESVAKALQKAGNGSTNCQARLLTSGLFPENGVKVFRFDTIPDHIKAEYEERLIHLVNSIASEVYPIPQKASDKGKMISFVAYLLDQTCKGSVPSKI